MDLSANCFRLLFFHGQRLGCCKNDNISSVTPIDAKIKSFAFLFFCSIPLLICGITTRLVEKCCCSLPKNSTPLVTNLGHINLINQKSHGNLSSELTNKSSPIDAIDWIILQMKEHSDVVKKLKERQAEVFDLILDLKTLPEIYSYFPQMIISFALILKELTLEKLNEIKKDACRNEESEIIDSEKVQLVHKIINITCSYQLLDSTTENFTFEHIVDSLFTSHYHDEAIIILANLPSNCTEDSKLNGKSYAKIIEHYTKNNLADAVKTMESAKFIDMSILRSHFYIKIAEAYLAKGDLTNAKNLSDHTDLMGVDANNLRIKIAEAYLAKGELENAKNTTKWTNYNSDHLRIKIAEAYLDQGELEKAKEVTGWISNREAILRNDLYFKIAEA